MKVIFIDNSIDALLNFRKDVIESFISDGWEVIVILTASDLKSDSVRNIPKGWRIYGPDMIANGMNPIKDLKYIKELISIFKKERPDIVMTYTVKPNIYGSIACAICHIPSIAMMAGLGFMFNGYGLKKKLGRFLYKFAMSIAKNVIVLNKNNYEQLISSGFVDSSKLIWFEGGEGVNLERYKSTRKTYGNVRFLMIARLLFDKGYKEYIEAAKIVKQKYPEVIFEILGGTAYSSPMGVPQDVFEKDIQEGYVKYLGVTDNVPSFINRDGTVVVVPSKYLEGLNRSLMEACAAACPIITTDIPGCRETIKDGINGFLVPKGDSNELAHAMIKMILLTEEQREAMAKESHKLAKTQFDVQNVIEKYKILFCDVLNK